MFEYTCPSCHQTNTTTAIDNGPPLPCSHCHQLLRVVLSKVRRGGPWWGSPGMAGVCALVGILSASAILAVGFFPDRAPTAAPDNSPAQAPSENFVAPKRDGGSRVSQPVTDKDKPVADKAKLVADKDKPVASLDNPPPRKERPEEVLVRALNDPDLTRRLQTVQKLSVLGPDARAAVPALLLRLRDAKEQEAVRAAAEQALQQIGTPTKQELPALLEALLDAGSAPGRRYAAAALGGLKNEVEDIQTVLLLALQDKDALVRRNVTVALGKITLRAKGPVQAALFTRLGDTDPEVRRCALETLLPLGRPDHFKADVCKAALADGTASVELRLYAVARLVEAGEEALPALTAALTTTVEPAVGQELAAALGRIKARTPEVGQALVRALDHKDKTIRRTAAESLNQLGLDATTLPGVLKALASSELEVCRPAARGLPNFSSFRNDRPTISLTKESLDNLKSALRSPEPLARMFAAHALGTLRADAAPAVPDLRMAFLGEKNGDPKLSPAIRLEILLTLAEIGPAALPILKREAEPFLLLLQALAEGKEEKIQELGQDKDPRSLRTLSALVLTQVAPDKPQAQAGFSRLAEVVLQKNPAASPRQELDLHERAKKTLAKGERPAADAVVGAIKTLSESQPLSEAQIAQSAQTLEATGELAGIVVMEALRNARGTGAALANQRKALLQVIEKLGKKAYSPINVQQVKAFRSPAYEIFPDVRIAASRAVAAMEK